MHSFSKTDSLTFVSFFNFWRMSWETVCDKYSFEYCCCWIRVSKSCQEEFHSDIPTRDRRWLQTSRNRFTSITKFKFSAANCRKQNLSRYPHPTGSSMRVSILLAMWNDIRKSMKSCEIFSYCICEWEIARHLQAQRIYETSDPVLGNHDPWIASDPRWSRTLGLISMAKMSSRQRGCGATSRTWGSESYLCC